MVYQSPYLNRFVFKPRGKQTSHNTYNTIFYPYCEYFAYIFELFLPKSKEPEDRRQLKPHSQQFQSHNSKDLHNSMISERLKSKNSISQSYTGSRSIISVGSRNSSMMLRKYFEKPNDGIFIKCLPTFYEQPKPQQQSQCKPNSNSSLSSVLQNEDTNDDTRNIELLANARICKQETRLSEAVYRKNSNSNSIVHEKCFEYNVQMNFSGKRQNSNTANDCEKISVKQLIETNDGNEEDQNSDIGYDNDSVLDRRIILDKLPTKNSEQLKLLKRVLNKMAIDGFPLAKLPDAHKLPHFRLWLRFRSHRFTDKHTNLAKIETAAMAEVPVIAQMARSYENVFNHCKRCNLTEMKTQKESTEEAIMTSIRFLKRAKKLRAITRRLRLQKRLKKIYETSLKTSRILKARELWASIYAYRLATAGNQTRELFFAYMPSQMANNYVYRPWRQYERMPLLNPIIREPKKRQRNFSNQLKKLVIL